jgi:hypothetical protein
VEEAIGDDVQVIPVSSLDEALAALESLGGDVGPTLRAPGASRS